MGRVIPRKRDEWMLIVSVSLQGCARDEERQISRHTWDRVWNLLRGLQGGGVQGGGGAMGRGDAESSFGAPV